MAVSGVEGPAIGSFQKVALSLTGIGFDVLRLRLPLFKSTEIPHGRVRPSFAIGPSVFITRFSETSNFSPSGQSDTNTSVGFKTGLGVLFLISQQWGVVREYRITALEARAKFRDMTPPPTQETLKFTQLTQHFVGGLSFQW